MCTSPYGDRVRYDLPHDSEYQARCKSWRYLAPRLTKGKPFETINTAYISSASLMPKTQLFVKYITCSVHLISRVNLPAMSRLDLMSRFTREMYPRLFHYFYHFALGSKHMSEQYSPNRTFAWRSLPSWVSTRLLSKITFPPNKYLNKVIRGYPT